MCAYVIQGSFGIAILYRRKPDDHCIVFKQINLNDLTPAERDLAMNEVDVFSKLHHPNIIRFKQWIIPPKKHSYKQFDSFQLFG